MPYPSDADHARINQFYEKALRAMREGRVIDAIALLRKGMVAGAYSPELLDCLGTALQMLGVQDMTTLVHRQALFIDPDDAGFAYNLGNTCQRAGLMDDAEVAFNEALRLRPSYVEAHNNLASLLALRGRYEEAIRSYRLALALDSNYHAARLNLGNALKEQGSFAAAEGCYRAVLAQLPEADDAAYGLANVLAGQGKTKAAIAMFHRLLARRPDRLEALNNLYVLLSEEGRLKSADAVRLFGRIVTITPMAAEAQTNLGNALRDEGRFDDALRAHRLALAIRPGYAKAYSNLASVFYQQGDLADAIASYRRAVDLDTDIAAVQFNLAIALLADGQWTEGWQLYEGRWKSGHRHIKPRKLPKPLWQGESLIGQTILVHAEQGYGDALQFCRYAQMLAERGAKVVLCSHPPLARLLSTVPGVSLSIADGDELPPFDVHVPMLSLPFMLGTTLDTVPATIPYLSADRQAVAVWERRLAHLPGLKVGLVWAGDPRLHDPQAAAVDRRRSMRLESFLPLLALPENTFLSLQKGPPTGQMAAIPPEYRPLDMGGDLADFADTAALIENLDLLIAVDTAVVHLAGALGKPVWILSRFDACWRWQNGREDTPWYPSARLFRQPKPGDWELVIARVRAELISQKS